MGAAEVEELPPVATVAVVSAFLGVSIPTLARWRQTRQGPPYVKVGHQVRYLREDLQAWLKSKSAAS